MKKSSLIITVLAAGVCTSSGHGRPAHPTGLRSVELISIGSSASPPDLAPADAIAPADIAPPPALQINELNRRAVEFRMAQALAEMAAQPAVAPLPSTISPGAIAPVSAIAVPTWMRTAAAVPATMTFVPGCEASVYRPTGFLTGAAERRRAAYYGLMSSVACEQGIPVGLFDAMILRESGYDPAALSTKRAFGFAQLMPDTAASLGVNRYDPLDNMRGGARYLRQQLDRFGRVELALAAYNAGPKQVRGGLVPGISETQAYVSDIIAKWQRLAGAGPHAEVIPSR